MSKRILSVLLSLILTMTMVVIPSYAATNASDYISSYNASLYQGDGSGELDVPYSITSAAGIMPYVGVSKIVVYRQNGMTYKTIYGTTANGLMDTNTAVTAGTYTIQCVPGYSYYCKVTFYVGDGTNGDARTVTTGTVCAPWS